YPVQISIRYLDASSEIALIKFRLLTLGLYEGAVRRDGQPLGRQRVAEPLAAHAVPQLDLLDVAVDFLVARLDAQGGDFLVEQPVSDERIEQPALLQPIGAALLRVPPELEGRDRLAVDGGHDAVDDLAAAGTGDEDRTEQR